jgi:hypothetical protein
MSRTVGLALVLALLGLSGCAKKEGRRVTGWDPKAGPYTGGGTVNFTGNGLDQTGVKVYFGDKAANVLYTSETMIKVEAPPGDVGKAVDILVQFDDAKALPPIEKGYTYEDTQKDLSVDGLVDGKAGPGTAPTPGTTPTPMPTPTPTPTPTPEGATPPPAPAPEGATPPPAPAPQ